MKGIKFQDRIGTYQNKVVAVHPKAFGGVISYDGDYATHTFLTSGSFTVALPGDMTILLVGGGGGGKFNNFQAWCMGGGGGGQVIYTTANVSIGYYDISIGAGGDIFADGQNSYFSIYTAIGGKTPAGAVDFVGGGYSGSGLAGGNGSATGRAGGGGAGSAAVGGNYTTAGGWTGGNGGAGFMGYGGGGGGAGDDNIGKGVDGGGDGGKYPGINATDASANSGGGGGGGIKGAQPSWDVKASKGGSGIAIIRYKYK